MVLSVLGLWLGASNHCLLENIPALKFLVCSPDGEAAPHQNSDCEKDSCAAVEKAAFKTEKADVVAASPMLLLAAPLLPATRTEAQLDPSFEAFPTPAPELPVTWQFISRTALPIRAPSIAS